jgi:predicted XRE-type DNA-binding protein
MAKTNSTIERGSGNVFADLGFADAGERKLKVQLAMEINKLLSERGLTQSASAELFGIAQPHVSELANYKLNRFSSERLMHFLTCLEQDVEIVVRPIKKSRGKLQGAITLSHAVA